MELQALALSLGFQAARVANLELAGYRERFQTWLADSFHGEMAYLEKHAILRGDPSKILPQAKAVILVRLDYLPPNAPDPKRLQQGDQAYIACYAQGRDYHKLMRRRLQKLVTALQQQLGPFAYRAVTDSAPVLEKALAEKAGLGWIGKNTLLLNRSAGSWFFLGALLVDLPLIPDEPVQNHCGRCQACIDICPTQAIVAPYVLDARRCISYLTIEYRGSIPIELRPLIGNRIFGCDDCQIICPWNRFAQFTQETDFHPRHGFDQRDLVSLFLWTEAEFEKNTQGSAIRRTGYEGWLRNIAVALGNAPTSTEVITALKTREFHPSALVREHVTWALSAQLSHRSMMTIR